MKNFLLKTLLLLPLLASIACSGPKKQSPMIYFSNVSPSPIFNVHCKWANGTMMSLPSLNPGESQSQSFYIRKNKEFFGLITISWLNMMGDQISRELYFREKHMPGINEEGGFNYVQFYIDQQSLDIMSSDEADLAGKIKRMDSQMIHNRNEYAKTHQLPISQLVTVDRPKENDSSFWVTGVGSNIGGGGGGGN